MSAVAGFVGKLAAPALQRAGSMLFQKFVRLNKVDTALRGVVQSEQLDTAISDYEIVKGTWRGEFTEEVDKFLRALERSGLATSLMEEALTGRATDAVRDAFMALYSAEIGGEREVAIGLYAEITSSFSATVEGLCKDPVLLSVIRNSTSDFHASLAQVESSISSILAGIRSRPTEDDIQSIYPRLARALLGRYKSLQVETNQGPKEVEIGRIYIAPKLTVRSTPETAARMDSLIEISRNSAQGGAHEAIERQKSISLADKFTYAEIRAGFNRTVILGDPGGGKSTFCQHICYEFAQEVSHSIAPEPSRPTGLQKFPFRIILRDFERARLSDGQLTLFDFLVNDLLHSVNVDRANLAATIEYLIGSGNAIVAFDGLDEILKTSLRRQFVDYVVEFSRQYPLCPVLITSRVVGYDKAPLPSEFDQLILDRFDDDEVVDYATKFIRVVAKRKLSEAKGMAAKFMAQSSANAKDLRRNPLMLGLMMWIFNIRGDVPSNRPEIYQECARLMFERWDADRGIDVGLPQTFDRLQIFSWLASKIFTDDELAGGVSSDWIESQSRSYLCEVLESRPQAYAAARQLIDFITGRAWVMSEKGEGVFSFTHQTFLEYFFAKFLDDAHDTVEEILDIIMPRVQQQEWDVVAQLALQIKTYRNRRRQDEALSILRDRITDDALSGDERISLMDFGARCLEFLSGSEVAVRDFVVSILRECFAIAYSGKVSAIAVVEALTTVAGDRREYVGKVIVQWVVEEYLSASEVRREILASAIDGSFQNKSGGTAAIQRVAAIDSVIASRIREILIPTLAQQAHDNLGSAQRLFSWTATIRASSLKRFGLGPFHLSVPPAGHLFTDGLAGLVLATSSTYSRFYSGTRFSKKNATGTLQVIGKWARSALPLKRAEFKEIMNVNNPPTSVWSSMLGDPKSNIDVRLGALLCAHLSLALGRRSDDASLDEARDRRNGSLQQATAEVVDLLVANGDVRVAEQVAVLGSSGPFQEEQSSALPLMSPNVAV